MTFQQAWAAIANDAMLHAMVILVAVDIILGVSVAIRTSEFTFAKLALFARDDILGKLVPWGVLYLAWKLAPSADVIGVDFEVISRGAGAIVIAALVGSMTASLADLGIKLPVPGSAKGEQ